MRIISKVLVVALVSGVSANSVSAFTTNKTPLTRNEKAIENLGTGIAIALPVIAGGITLWQKDGRGSAQLITETALTVGTAYLLKNVVREQRPDGSDYHSFPSNTTALAASGSTFLWRRYGWEYGLPAVAMTEFVAYSRVQARQHRWYDTLASSAIAAGYGYVLIPRFKRNYNVDTSLDASPDGAIIRLSYEW